LNEPLTPDFRPHNALSVTSTLFFSRLDVTDSATQATATLLSNLSLKVGGEWAQHWNKFVESAFTVGLSEISMQTVSAKTLQNPSHQLLSLEASVALRPLERVSISLHTGTAQSLFLRALTVDSLILDQIPLFYQGADISLLLVVSDPFILTGGAGLIYTFGSNNDTYQVLHGLQYQGNFGIKTRLGEKASLTGVAYVLSQTFATSISTQVWLETGFSFGLHYDF
jgi:hypothetical protein